MVSYGMRGPRNILQAIENGEFERFLDILNEAFRAAARRASDESHALGLDVVDGRAGRAADSQAPGTL